MSHVTRRARPVASLVFCQNYLPLPSPSRKGAGRPFTSGPALPSMPLLSASKSLTDRQLMISKRAAAPLHATASCLPLTPVFVALIYGSYGSYAMLFLSYGH